MFELFLRHKHAELYFGTKDKVKDAFEKWLEDLSTDQMIAYADEFAGEYADHKVSISIDNK